MVSRWLQSTMPRERQHGLVLLHALALVVALCCAAHGSLDIYPSAENSATTVIVGSCGNETALQQYARFDTIEHALSADNASTIVLCNGTYTGAGFTRITFDRSVHVIAYEQWLKLNGDEPSLDSLEDLVQGATIDCQGNGWGWAFTAGAHRISGITITGCNGAISVGMAVEEGEEDGGGDGGEGGGTEERSGVTTTVVHSGNAVEVRMYGVGVKEQSGSFVHEVDDGLGDMLTFSGEALNSTTVHGEIMVGSNCALYAARCMFLPSEASSITNTTAIGSSERRGKEGRPAMRSFMCLQSNATAELSFLEIGTTHVEGEYDIRFLGAVGRAAVSLSSLNVLTIGQAFIFAFNFDS